MSQIETAVTVRAACYSYYSKLEVPDAYMLKFDLIAGRIERLADDAEYIVESARMDEMTTAEFREILDDSPTDEMEVIRGRKDD